MMRQPYKLVTLAVSVCGGLVAGAIFKRLWKLVTGEDEAPEATDASHRWHEVLVAAAAQGAVVALVKAMIDRGAAQAAGQLTGARPGDLDDQQAGRGKA
jgi:hypothetical protein